MSIEAMKQHGAFSWNELTTMDVAGAKAFYGELPAAPMIRQCPLNIECRVERTVDLPTNSFFIAEIINIYCSEEFLTDGRPDIEKIKPFVLTMPDNRFWAIGDCIGRAWDAGKNMRRHNKNP